jgi:recombination protein RecT
MTAQTVSQAVATRETGPVAVMWGKRSHFNAVLPQHIDVESFLGTAAGALYASDVAGRDVTLMKCAQANPDSLVTALMRCAALGHQPGTDEFYLTPRKVKGRLTVQGIEGYRGIVERMYRSGAVTSVVVREVCANDEFDYAEGVHDKPVHRVNWFGGGRGEMIGVYAYATLTTGAVSRVVILSRDDVMAAKAASDAGNSSFSPWNRADGGTDHPEFTGRSMWWKTAARRLEPWVPTSAEYRREQLRAAATADSLAGGRPGSAPSSMPAAGPQDVVDAEIVGDTTDASPAEQQAPAAAAPAPPAQPAGEAPDDRPPAMATGGQVGMIQSKFERLGYDLTSPDDQQAMLRRAARLAGADDLTDLNQLTQERAKWVTDQLKDCDDVTDLDRLLESGEKPETGDE